MAIEVNGETIKGYIEVKCDGFFTRLPIEQNLPDNLVQASIDAYIKQGYFIDHECIGDDDVKLKAYRIENITWREV